MRRWLKTRVRVFRSAASRRWPKWAFVAWAILSSYDTAGQQLLPKWLAQRLPSFYESLEMTTGFLPWWGWLLILLAGCVVWLLEFAVRQDRKIRSLDWRERLGASGVWAVPIFGREPVLWSGFDHFVSVTTFAKESLPHRITAFRLHGRNAFTRRQLTIKNAYIRALVEHNAGPSTEHLDVWVEGAPNLKNVVIDANAQFAVSVRIPSHDGHSEGPTVKEFLDRFSYFKFVCVTDRGHFEQEFTLADVEGVLSPLMRHTVWGYPKERTKFNIQIGSAQ